MLREAFTGPRVLDQDSGRERDVGLLGLPVVSAASSFAAESMVANAGNRSPTHAVGASARWALLAPSPVPTQR